MFDVFVNFYFMNLCLLIFVVLNTASAVIIWLDKRNAQSGKKRISEHTLLVWALVGGWPGVICAMRRFRHKTSKRSFIVKFVMVVLLNLATIITVVFAAIA